MKQSTWFLSILLILCLLLSFTGCREKKERDSQVENTSSSIQTYTIGNVSITMDVAKVDVYGMYETDITNRTTDNSYKLMPGKTYIQDPTIHISADSDDAWLFVKIENQISDVTEPLQLNGWQPVEGYDNLYVYTGSGIAPVAVAGSYDIVVFESFTIRGDATNQQLEQMKNKSISVNAFGIQAEGVRMEDAVRKAANALGVKQVFNGSHIKAGVLDTELDNKTTLFTIDNTWEPGYSETASTTLENVGNLALKYSFSIANLQCEGNANIAKVLEVYSGVYPGVDAETGASIIDGTLLGTLAELAEQGTFVIYDDNGTNVLLPGDKTPINLIIKMKESAGNEYQNAQCSFDINVLATQIPYEVDDNNNPDYDQEAAFELPTR